jgi:hypothetical protein
MFGEENKEQDLKAFEAALRSLRPRTDRLDSQWRNVLAKEATVASELGAGSTSSCTNPSGHLFLCIYCGSDAVRPRGAGRWAWPAALSTVTAVAAILLAMLVTRSEPQIALRGGQQGAATLSPSVVQQPAHPAAVDNGRVPEDQLAMGSVGRRPQNFGTEEMSYLALRDQVLRDGVESWKFPVSAVVTTARTTEGPLSYREQLERLLKQQGLRGS